MLDQLTNLFQKRSARHQAALAMARIISRYDIAEMPYECGVNPERRSHDERHVAFGVWLTAYSMGNSFDDINFSAAVPAVTYDLRSEGFGVMTPLHVNGSDYVLAVPNDNNQWRFFITKVCHNTKKPGDWYQVGLHVDGVVELNSVQKTEFREHVEQVHANAGQRPPVASSDTD